MHTRKFFAILAMSLLVTTPAFAGNGHGNDGHGDDKGNKHDNDKGNKHDNGWHGNKPHRNQAPPKVKYEARGVSPIRGGVWAPGYYTWQPTTVRYVWAPGRWVAPPRPQAVWAAPAWVLQGDGWTFSAGYWR
ncbi:MAG: YXWGXW repeat-containing protein [Candidatus Sericytochromatia bacterium]|nr:YXWGXW repeat-containing protein [Candidatus Sericytochromatia bacterium]